MQLSIIVPIYNTGKYLRRCLDSIASQTFKDFEVILVDDGSIDVSAKICDEYVAKDIRFKVIHKNNEGLILARQSGLKIASGRFIGFIDSDDWIESNMYDELVQNTIDSNVDICIGGYIIEKMNKEVINPFILHNKFICSSDIALIHMFEGKIFNWSLCDKIYKKDLFNGFQAMNIKNPYGEDSEMNWYLFGQAYRVLYKPIKGYYYCMNNASMTHKPFSIKKLYYIDRLVNIIDKINDENLKLKIIISKLIFASCINYIFKMINEKIDYRREIKRYQTILKKSFGLLKNKLTKKEKHRYVIAQMDYFDMQSYQNNQYMNMISRCTKFTVKYNDIFIYGAGIIAKEIAQIFDKNNINYSGFVVSNLDKKNIYLGKKVICFSDILKKDYNQQCGLILALNEKNTTEVVKFIKSNSDISYISVGKYSWRY